jgi:hypothetical protein
LLVKGCRLRAELLKASRMRGKQRGDFRRNLIGGRGQDTRRRGGRRAVGVSDRGTNIR